MNSLGRLIAVVTFATGYAAIVALASRQDIRSPDARARAHYATLPEFQDGSIVLDTVETLSGWDEAPERFAVVRTFARRLGHGSPDRGRNQVLVLHESGEVISKLRFASLPVVEHANGQLRIFDNPPIDFSTPADALALSQVNADDLIASRNAAALARAATASALAAYNEHGREALIELPMSNCLGRLASPRPPACGRASGIRVAADLPERIAAFDIAEITFTNTHTSQMRTTKTWEVLVDATLIDANTSERYAARVLVSGDRCDSDLIASVQIE